MKLLYLTDWYQSRSWDELVCFMNDTYQKIMYNPKWIITYFIYPKYSDRKDRAKSVDPDRAKSVDATERIYTVCHSSSILDI